MALIGQVVSEKKIFEYYCNIIQLFHASAGNSAKYFSRGAEVPTWHAIARSEAEGNSMSSRYLYRGENVLHYCLFKLEITVLLPN